MDTTAPPPLSLSKKQSRDQRRSEEFRERKRAERWLPLVQPFLRRMRWQSAQDVWTTWMRSRPSPKPDVRRKLRSIFWRAWTDRWMEMSIEDPVLGLMSYRDEYIRTKARALCRRYIPESLAKKPTRGDDIVMDDMSDFGLTGFDPADVQAAISASLANASPSTRQAGKSTVDSARSSKKRGGRSKRG